ncbi:shieldin complex subunit 2 [Pseudophryne corroboree]|uniref:shieldin complex subunit 2 n=1 Tax=Pseudophryne corroboree TaxID=495146 RepID=UPI0030814586
MADKGIVHIFIGAPTISPSVPWKSDIYPSDVQKTKWEEIPYDYNEQTLCLQNISNSKTSVTPELLGGALYGNQNNHISVGCDRSEQLPVVSSKYKTNFAQKAATHSTGIISDLVFNTKKCHITSSFHKSARAANAGLRDHLDASFSEKTEDHNGVQTNPDIISAETEFLTVLTSSQVAVEGCANVFEYCVPFAQDETKPYSPSRHYQSAGSPKMVLRTTTAAESTAQDYFACSLELFTQISDHESNKAASAVQKSEMCQENMKCLEKSTAGIIELSNHVESTSCKRKKIITTSPSPKIDQKSKKPKNSTSLEFLKRRFDEHRLQTPVNSLTLLKHCSEKNKEYNILAVVLHPCYVKEIQIKSRPNAGSSCPLATIIVLDQSAAECKVLMWRSAAFWSLALFPGAIIMLTNMMASEDKWNEKPFLQSTFRSRLIQFGSCSTLLPEESSNIVNYSVLQELMDYIHINHYYLKQLPPRQPQKLDNIQYVRLAQLQPELLVHSILKVRSISILKECTYHFKGLQQQKIILTIEEVRGQMGALILWGASISWCDQIRRKMGHIWAFKYLLAKKNLFSGDLELHTTPWSYCECLFDDDKRAVEFQKRYIELVLEKKQMSMMAIIEDRYSGDIQVKAGISQLEFLIPGNENIFMTQETSITYILMSLPAVIYSGCGKCKTELKVDDNYVYEQCLICLPYNQVRTIYRPVLMTITSEDCGLRVHVPSDILEKIFLNISPNLLHKTVDGFSDVTYGTVVADLCHSLMAKTGESYLFLIRSHFLLDENSVPLEQEFHVLDFHLDL